MKDIQGIQRGKCNSCECEEYRAPVESGRLRCEYCNHTPGEHVKIIELGACRSCGKDDCDKYVSEDPNSYTDCQYCGCSANNHAGAEALRKPKPQPTFPPYGDTAPGTVPVTAVTGPRTLPANFPQPPGQSIQPRMTVDGKVTQTSAHGNCSFPGCHFPRSFDGDRVHDYCSRTCAQKHAELRSAFEKQKAAAAGLTCTPPGDPQGLPQQRIMVQAHERTMITKRSGGPPQAATFTTVMATNVPGQPSGGDGGVTPIGGVGGGSAQLCKKCGVRPANLGRAWCQQCFITSKGM